MKNHDNKMAAVRPVRDTLYGKGEDDGKAEPYRNKDHEFSAGFTLIDYKYRLMYKF